MFGFRRSKYEYNKKHAWGDIPKDLHTIKYYSLYASSNYSYCFDNNTVGFKGQTNSVKFLQASC